MASPIVSDKGKKEGLCVETQPGGERDQNLRRPRAWSGFQGFGSSSKRCNSLTALLPCSHIVSVVRGLRAFHQSGNDGWKIARSSYAKP